MRRLVLTAIVFLSLCSVVTVVTAVPDARIVISDATPQSETTVIDSPTTVDVTVSLAGGSPSAVELDSVAIVDESGTELKQVTTLGTLSQGGALTIPVTVTFTESGVRELTVDVRGTDENGADVTATRPLTIGVERAPPLLDVGSIDPVVGAETTLPVSIGNPTNDQLRNITLTVRGDGVTDRSTQRSITSLAPGDVVDRELVFIPETAGQAEAVVEVRYTTSAGSVTVAERPVSYAASELVTDLGVRVSDTGSSPTGDTSFDQPTGVPGGFGLDALLGGQPGGGDEADEPSSMGAGGQQLVLTNFGNAPVTSIVVTPRTADGDLPRIAVEESVQPGASTTADVDLRRVPAGTVTFSVSFETAATSQQQTLQYEHRPDAGDVTLTGASIEEIDGSTRISGNLGNPTGGTVTGVVVAVADTETVSPAYPQRDYFVGTLEPGEFAPFDVTATIDAEATTNVSVDVTFRVDGAIETQTFSLPYESPSGSDTTGSTVWRSVGFWLTGLGVVAGGAITAVYIRRR
ncbi:hypothetical protein [Natronocalculus amylovorans]|uniref:CARDB domain-containing protein n=1 Tax=Natronocalculus amylovorans TaxID=2917812 RepID=A0AAE3FW03_9EURY|nr:hypothetical protein [Natronocalculus amylovorans]MCL9815674.1 hypothetical protein [Natronocalculus amylovorans]